MARSQESKSFGERRGEDVRIDAQSPLNACRQRERREDGRAAECGGGLATAFIAVANVDCQRLREGRLEGYGAAF